MGLPNSAKRAAEFFFEHWEPKIITCNDTGKAEIEFVLKAKSEEIRMKRNRDQSGIEYSAEGDELDLTIFRDIISGEWHINACKSEKGANVLVYYEKQLRQP